MDIFELIKNRRSVMPPQYTDKAISKENLKQILEAATWAPTHRRTEPWRFKVLLGNAKKKLGIFLSRKYRNADPNFSQFKFNKYLNNPQKAAAVLGICMQRDPNESVPEWEEIAAVAMAVQNMWLQATALQIGAYWSSPALIKYMDEFFEMQKGESCLGFFYMGYYKNPSPARIPAPIEEKVQWLD